MISIRKAQQRGHFDHGWLDTWHSFSFGEYRDPRNMGFRALRVINEDVVSPGAGFGKHGHRDMEIITYVLSGALEHQDSMGNRAVMRPGDIQRISAGAGILHSEYNASQAEPVHLLQIWIEPSKTGVTPRYDERHVPDAEKRGRLRPLAAPDKEAEALGALGIHQDARVYATIVAPGETLRYPVGPDRHIWVQVVRGDLQVNGESLTQGDSAALSDIAELTLAGVTESEVLVFDLN